METEFATQELKTEFDPETFEELLIESMDHSGLSFEMGDDWNDY